MDPRIIEALKQLNPGSPAAAGVYVGRAVEGRARTWTLPERLRVLLAAGERFRVLMHGCVGVGKTTELDAIERALGVDNTVLRVAVRLGANDRVDNAAHEQVHRALISYLGAQVTLEDAYAQARQKSGRPLVILVDGVDLASEERTASALATGSWMAADWLPPIVYVVSHSIITWGPHQRDPAFDTPAHLAPFPVIRSDGRPDADAILHFGDGLARRLPDPRIIGGRDLLYRIALSSGGIPRDAIHILRAALIAAADVGHVNEAHVLEGERELRQDLDQSLRPGDADILDEVNDKAWYVGDASLVIKRAVLPYDDPAGERYWRVHPLLDHVIRRDRSLDRTSPLLFR